MGCSILFPKLIQDTFRTIFSGGKPPSPGIFRTTFYMIHSRIKRRKFLSGMKKFNAPIIQNFTFIFRIVVPSINYLTNLQNIGIYQVFSCYTLLNFLYRGDFLFGYLSYDNLLRGRLV